VLVLTNTSVVTIFNSPISRSLSLRKLSCLARNACAAIALGFLFWANTASAQSSYEDLPGPIFAPIPLSLTLPVSSPQQGSDSNEQSRSSSVTRLWTDRGIRKLFRARSPVVFPYSFA